MHNILLTVLGARTFDGTYYGAASQFAPAMPVRESVAATGVHLYSAH
jgi:hypothetical protein